ncbi:MAG: sulfite exporter TauE/SafE family protein [Betaproteobacteria bacterium]
MDSTLLPLFGMACLAAFLASILGGVSGFGTGLVLPAFLAPLVGVEHVIPVMAVAMLFTNGSRVVVFWRDIHWLHVRRIIALGFPSCVAGAYGYTLLNANWVAVLLGIFLLVCVPLRRILRRSAVQSSASVEVIAGGGFGLVNGGMSGTGILLISILMSAGLSGEILIATDAVISLLMGVTKVVLFGGLSALTLELASIGLLIGFCTTPGAFVARWLLKYIPAGIHAWIMELIVVIGAVSLLKPVLW